MTVGDGVPDLYSLNSYELDNLVWAASDVLSSLVPDAGRIELNLSPRAAALMLNAEDDELEVQATQALLEAPAASRAASLYILEQLKSNDELFLQIGKVYQQRSRSLNNSTTLLAGALFVLAIKLKGVKWTKDEKTVSFYEASTAIKEFILSASRRLN